MANSVDPDQTAPLGAVSSGFTLFAEAYLSKILWLIAVLSDPKSGNLHPQMSRLVKNQHTDMCAQQKLRSAWASAQSVQSLCCVLNG